MKIVNNDDDGDDDDGAGDDDDDDEDNKDLFQTQGIPLTSYIHIICNPK